ncbi:MAG: SDR family oxidoreductase [Alphaproteobacteria bacterium]|nr:SDR family oxidoreductase [Alphaproteobacteria bacterium]
MVADKTGYPAEMLSSEMDLEADLGVDSIKRVEILSALREAVPGLPDVDAGELSSLRTLGEIATALGAGPAASSPAAVPAPAAPASGGGDLTGQLLAVVADKTGYPAEMLSSEMDLEADLGVDSIKRVEILSALREAVPGLPDVDAGELSSLRTLGEIATALGAGPAASPAPVASAPAAPASGGGGDLTSQLLAVVADKTGYPAEMLSSEMDLEADLGVDSIKRVEILSALREAVPGLPDVDAGELSSLRTLGEIAGALGAGPPGAAPAEGGSPPFDGAPADGLGRFVVEAVEVAAPGLSVAGLWSGIVQVIDGGSGVGEALAARLRSVGVDAVLATEVSPEAAGVVLLSGLLPDPDRATARVVLTDAFAIATAIAPSFTERGGVFITVQDTGGDLGSGGREPERAWLAGLTGLAKTAALEWPSATVRALDVASAGLTVDEVAERVAQELLTGGDTREVGLTVDGRRLTLTARLQAPATGPLALGAQDVVVVSGGGRGVTAATVVALARASRARFVLLGRTALAVEPEAARGVTAAPQLKRVLLEEARSKGEALTPRALGTAVDGILAAREVRGTVAAIEAAGGAARYVVADVTDVVAVRDALMAVRASWGPVTGVIHGAGVLADRLLADKTPDQVARVLGTKLDGLAALLDATAADPLKVLLSFGSVAGRTGNRGQADYAAANEVLSKVGAAQAAARPGLVARTLAWGPWAGGMVTPELERHFASAGVPLIPLERGAQMLVDELREGPGVTEVVLGPEPEVALGQAAGPPAFRAALRVDETAWPMLADHRVRGEAVVPLALASEWLARAAAGCRPELVIAELRQVEVVRGVRLAAGAATVLTLEARELANGDGSTVLVEARDPEGALRYRAQVRLEQAPPVAGEEAPPPSVPPWGDTVVYDGRVLFHGAAFQVLREVEGVGEEGAVARADGLLDRGWAQAAWSLDPAALDAALQLGLVWAEGALGAANLPLAIEALRVLRPGATRGPLTVTVRRRSATAERALCEVVVRDDDGVILELRGLSLVKLPGEPPAHLPSQTGTTP